jgi:hypothetical protein
MSTPILETLTALAEPGAIVEVRILHTRRGTVSGYFDDMAKLADAVSSWNGKSNIYVTLNPVNPDLLSRANNRLVEYAKHTTADSDILCRRWLPVDFDPVRPSGISSTNAEHRAALDRASECRRWLVAQGWPNAICADSGNGAHLVFPVDLPNDEASRILVEHILKALAFQFSDASVNVDLTTFNAARIWKLYGTTACKGDSTPERPHRMSGMLEVPECE